MKENIFQYPLRHSRVVWRHKAPNITTLLTNTILPKEKTYSSSHLCYNVYSTRIIDNEIESCVKSCTGVDIGIESGPILVQRYGTEDNGLEVLILEKFKDSDDFYFKRLMLMPNLIRKSIMDIKLQASSDFFYDKSNGINIFARSSDELVVVNLRSSEQEEGLECRVLLKSKISDLINRFREMEGVEGLLNNNGNSGVTIYSIISSLYDFLEFTLLLSNRVILRISLRYGIIEKKMELDLNTIYEFGNEVIQCITYGSNPSSYLLGGKGLYILKKDSQSNYQVRMLFPCKDSNVRDFEEDELEENTLRNLVSYKDRLMKLQILRKKNISYSNITGISVHPIYSNLVALIDSRSSRVVVIDLYQNSRIPLGEFSIPFTESLGNHTSRFRYMEWVNPEMVKIEQGINKCICGLMLYCSSYSRVIYSLIEFEYDDMNSNQYYKMSLKGVKELSMGTWDLNQDRNYYVPKTTQLLESNVDLLDMILESYSIDDNILSQIFHGLSGLTVFSLKKEYMGGYLVIPPSTSRHNILLNNSYNDKESFEENEDDKMNQGLIFLSLSTCGRLTCTNIYLVKEECIDFREGVSEEAMEGNEKLDRIRRLLHDQVFVNELSGVYLTKRMKESLGEFYQFILRKESGLGSELNKIVRLPQIMEPKVEDRMGRIESRVKFVGSDNLQNVHEETAEGNYINEKKRGKKDDRVESRAIDEEDGKNSELEVVNEQLTKRQYYNTRVYNGQELIDLLLEGKDDWEKDKCEDLEQERNIQELSGLRDNEDIELASDYINTPILSEMNVTPDLDLIEEDYMAGGKRTFEDFKNRRNRNSFGRRLGIYSDDSNWSMSEIMNSTKVELPLALTNGFDYRKEFKKVPGALWVQESMLFEIFKGECVHIPSLETQPFPLCSCRYFEENDSKDKNITNNNNHHLHLEEESIEGIINKSRPVFDIIGAKGYEYNTTLEEYLSFVKEDSEEEEEEKEKEKDKENGVYILNDTLKLLSDSIIELPLTPVSEKIAENYLKYNKYLGGKLNDKKILKKKWKISQSCSRMRQPGCLLKYLIINELEVKKAFREEEILREKEKEKDKGVGGLEDERGDNLTNLDEDELEKRLEVEMEDLEEDSEIAGEWGEGEGIEGGVKEVGEKETFEDFMDESEYEDMANLKKNILPNRGIYINEKLINTLKVFWDESCDFYGLNRIGHEHGEEQATIDLLNDDLSQWHNYPYISFESVDSNIEEKEQLRLSLMSYVDTQLSNV
ncbi:Uncharacterized protein cmbei_8001581 [Cryptosporidium meleagridis]